jgi:outer membrane lipoprotein
MVTLLKKKASRRRLILIFFLVWVAASTLASCVPLKSKQSQKPSMPTVTFDELSNNPNDYVGSQVVFGGYILELKNTKAGSLLTILQAPLDFQNRPNLREESKGRFLARGEKFLEPETYRRDRRVTVTGKIAGVLTQPIGDQEYQYPVIDAEKLQLWTDENYYDWQWDRYWDGWGPVYPYPRSTTRFPRRWRR